MKSRTIFLIIIIVAIGFLGYGSWTSKKLHAFWKETNIPCLPGGHTNAKQHIHQTLTITVDGTVEVIPANIGVDSLCMAEVHTHETDGQIHMETPEESTTHTLADFFTVWGTSFDRDGFTETITVNDKAALTPDEVILKDADVIAVTYTSEKNDTE